MIKEQQNLLRFITANIKFIKSFPEGSIETEREDKSLRRSLCSFRKKIIHQYFKPTNKTFYFIANKNQRP